MISTRVYFAGNVQGVGFRYSVKQIAKGFEITGTVRNLEDGRVELQANGDPDEVAAFIEAVTQSELRAHIKQRTETQLPEPVSARGFEIRHD